MVTGFLFLPAIKGDAVMRNLFSQKEQKERISFFLVLKDLIKH